jgi:S-adenosyl-L-methionine hydrolase (adenosine-forming)
MPIVTLTTDYGLSDYFVPALKGALLKKQADIQFIDMTHNIINHDIVQAAFVLKNAWHTFPDGTIHVVSVNNFGGEKNRFLVFEHGNHFFLGPDNGIFTLVLDDDSKPISRMPEAIFALYFSGLNYEAVRNCITEAVGALAQGQIPENLGYAIDDAVQRIHLQPITSPSQIRGAVVYIDNYGNVVTNIRRQLFQKIANERNFQLYFRRHDPITQLSEHYNDVAVGETLCIFNSDYLEIAINMGKAAEMLGLKIEDTIQIDFLTDI